MLIKGLDEVLELVFTDEQFYQLLKEKLGDDYARYYEVRIAAFEGLWHSLRNEWIEVENMDEANELIQCYLELSEDLEWQ